MGATLNKDEMRRRLGANIQACRISLDLTQQQLADMTGFSRSYIAEIESGKRNASVNNLFRIAQGLEVNLFNLFQGVD